MERCMSGTEQKEEEGQTDVELFRFVHPFQLVVELSNDIVY
jgi:hypothetical protein